MIITISVMDKKSYQSIDRDYDTSKLKPENYGEVLEEMIQTLKDSNKGFKTK